MDKKIFNTLIFGLGAVGIIILIVLLSQQTINTVTFFIITGIVILVAAIVYFLINYLKQATKIEIKQDEINQEKVLEDIRHYLMYHKFVQPSNDSEEIKFITLNKDLHAVYYCEDESTPRGFYVLFNIKLKLFSIFNNKLEIDNHINNIIKQQYVIKQRIVDRDSLTGREREQEEMIDKDEIEELKKIREEKEELSRLK